MSESDMSDALRADIEFLKACMPYRSLEFVPRWTVDTTGSDIVPIIFCHVLGDYSVCGGCSIKGAAVRDVIAVILRESSFGSILELRDTELDYRENVSEELKEHISKIIIGEGHVIS